jgi:hypothetical protein
MPDREWKRRALVPIDAEDIPLPYRSLLVHSSDMTLTLERHFGGSVVLRPLATFTQGPWYFRRVLLAQEYTAVRSRWAPSGYESDRSRAHPQADTSERHSPWTPAA